MTDTELLQTLLDKITKLEKEVKALRTEMTDGNDFTAERLRALEVKLNHTMTGVQLANTKLSKSTAVQTYLLEQVDALQQAELERNR